MKKILLSCLSLMFAAALSAADYYVATTGDDTNDGLSKETPFVTIAKAVSTATKDDVVKVAGGTYTGVWGTSSSKMLTLTGSWSADFSERPLVEGGEPWEFINQTIVEVGESSGTVWANNNSYNSIIEGVRFQNGTNIKGAMFTSRNTSFKRCALVNNTIGVSKHLIELLSPQKNDFTIENCLFENNSVTGSYTAAAINIAGTPTAACKINNCTFRENSSMQYLANVGGPVGKISEIINCSFYNNMAKTHIVTANQYTEMTNCLVYNNNITSSAKAFVQTSGKVTNCVIANNNNTNSSGGIVINAGGIVSNTIVWGNLALEDKKVVAVGFQGDIAATIMNCAFDGATLGELVIAADNISLSEELPKFVKPTSFAGFADNDEKRTELAAADWSLVGSSSLVDAGKMDLFSTTIYGALNEFDIVGNNRKFGEEIDMGTYETTYSVISATSADETKGTVTGGGRYSIGEEATLTATATSPASFNDWRDGASQLLSKDATYTFTVDAENAAISYVATFDNATSIGGEALLQSALYTSPGQLCISGAEGILTVFNSAGVKVVQQLITGSATISLSKDFYIVQIQNEQGISTSKVVIP